MFKTAINYVNKARTRCSTMSVTDISNKYILFSIPSFLMNKQI